MPTPHTGDGSFTAVVRGLAAMLGPEYCIVLYSADGEQPGKVVEVVNGQLVGLSAADRPPVADRAAIGDILQKGVGYVANYLSNTDTGRRLRSCLMRLTTPNGDLAGYLAIHYDLTKAELLKDMIARLTDGVPAADLPAAAGQPSRLDDLIGEGLRRARQYLGKPLAYASKLEKIQLVERLDREGFFLLKGSIEALAQDMGNTKYTIYSYLRENRIRVAD
ncbi:helix-turn-helix domain-containing protein [Anaeroselena agilis]|uniref:Helix-turn-helix domain-containing protein n=1 Tax=Anaeroselena agilis TaxID=3063788 RepID=A0ABU3P1X1_9FIRM|nr:helix-turn-helix domain-containing protein [Selenomonadales bacterium 4137-cl]